MNYDGGGQHVASVVACSVGLNDFQPAPEYNWQAYRAVCQSETRSLPAAELEVQVEMSISNSATDEFWSLSFAPLSAGIPFPVLFLDHSFGF